MGRQDQIPHVNPRVGQPGQLKHHTATVAGQRRQRPRFPSAQHREMLKALGRALRFFVIVAGASRLAGEQNRWAIARGKLARSNLAVGFFRDW